MVNQLMKTHKSKRKVRNMKHLNIYDWHEMLDADADAAVIAREQKIFERKPTKR